MGAAQLLENQVKIKRKLTGKPDRSAYFFDGLNEGGASTLLSARKKKMPLNAQLNMDVAFPHVLKPVIILVPNVCV